MLGNNPRRKNYPFVYMCSHPNPDWQLRMPFAVAAKERCTAIAHCAARRALEKAMKLSPSALTSCPRLAVERFRCGRERLHGRASHPTFRKATTNLQNRRQVWLLGVGTNAASYLRWLLSSPTAVGFYGQLLV
jgi:hypothetical protein